MSEKGFVTGKTFFFFFFFGGGGGGVDRLFPKLIEPRCRWGVHNRKSEHLLVTTTIYLKA